jgi:lysine 2,3-aminomutase
MDSFTTELLEQLFDGTTTHPLPDEERATMTMRYQQACQTNHTQPILALFRALMALKDSHGITPSDLGISHEDLAILAQKHESIDEHGVTIGGRLGRASKIVEAANERVKDYLACKDKEAPSRIE